MQAAKDVAGCVAGAAVGGASAVVGVVPDSVKQGAAGAVHMGRDAVESKAADFKETLETWLKQKIQYQLERVVDRIPGVVKSSLEDPDMPRAVSRAKDRSVEAVWPDIRDEIMWEVAVFLDGKTPEEEEDFGACCCLCRFFRYHIYPNDKTIWGALRDPVYLGFTLISLIPITGLCPFIYLLLFLIIDRGDEYQLIQFILQFKGTQFLSHGVIRTLTGFFIYMGCVTSKASEVEHSCEENGPGMAGRIEVIIGGWVLQIVLVWAAFCFLPCSKDKGRSQLAGKLQYEASDRVKRKGGALLYFLVWDMLSFLACSGFMVWFASTRSPLDKAYQDWAVKHVFFACQIVYGFLSMPYFFFMLPVLQAVLTHAVPTGYNRNGVCCKYKFTSRQKRHDERQEELLLSQQESNSILSDIKALFVGS